MQFNLTTANQRLRVLADKLAKIGLLESSELSIRSAEFEVVHPQLEALPNTVAIYVISLVSGDKEDLRKRYQILRTKRTGLALSRYNERLSECLYVGSSKKMKTRLRQHFGPTPKGTYALHLSEWGIGKKSRFDIQIFQHDSLDNPEVMQLIEDAMWDKLNPMFGKRGGK